VNAVILGDATLYLGECIETMRQIPDGSVDMVLCDLPYGTTACKWDSVIPFDALWSAYRRIVRPDGAICLFASQPFSTALAWSNMDDFRYEWIWVKNRKTGAMTAKIMPMKGHELVLVFGRRAPRYFRILTPRNKPISARTPKSRSDVYANEAGQKDTYLRRTDTVCPDSVLYFDTERGFHPTQKPVALMEYLIRTYTNEGDTVLDNTMGSGTTGVACANTGRQFIGIEREKGYFDIAVARLSAANDNRPKDDDPTGDLFGEDHRAHIGRKIA
jgi:site-specific DNA-methyltransferase (adenine-specific)